MKPIDRTTIEIGRVKSVEHAKRICRLLWKKLPRCGYEMTVDRSKNHHTCIVNEGGKFRVWTWFSVSAGNYDQCGFLIGKYSDYIEVGA